MKIAFDAQLLFEKQKTGIGFTVEHLLKSMELDNNDEFVLNYFSLRNGQDKERIIRDYVNKGYKKSSCLFYNRLYRKIYNKLPLPYSLFFRYKAQITQFFNYDMAPGVYGKSVTFIYDMAYKAYPETISKDTIKMLDHNLNRACKKSDHIITISEFSKNEIMKYMDVPENKISVVPCGVDHSVFHPDYSEDDIERARSKYGIPENYILYMGTLEPRKNIESLVEAYSILYKETDFCPVLVIAGKKGWMYETIFEKVHLLGMEKNIIFTGYINTDDVPLILKGAVVFVFPSVYEGFGLPPLEAMACGTPVITSNTASLPEVIGSAGILVNPFSVYEIKNAIQQMIIDTSKREIMRIDGILRAKEYTWEASSVQLKSVYKKILGVMV